MLQHKFLVSYLSSLWLHLTVGTLHPLLPLPVVLPVPFLWLLMPLGSLVPGCCLRPVSLLSSHWDGRCPHHNRGWGRTEGARSASGMLYVWVPLLQAEGPELRVLLQLEELGSQAPPSLTPGSFRPWTLLQLGSRNPVYCFPSYYWILRPGGGGKSQPPPQLLPQLASSLCSGLFTFRCTDVRISPVYWAEETLLRHECFTSCRLKGRDREHLLPPRCRPSPRQTFSEKNHLVC